MIGQVAPRARSLTGVPVPGHAHHSPARLAALAQRHGIAARQAVDVPSALRHLASDREARLVLILGSLYLAGTVLSANQELPD